MPDRPPPRWCCSILQPVASSRRITAHPRRSDCATQECLRALAERSATAPWWSQPQVRRRTRGAYLGTETSTTKSRPMRPARPISTPRSTPFLRSADKTLNTSTAQRRAGRLRDEQRLFGRDRLVPRRKCPGRSRVEVSDIAEVALAAAPRAIQVDLRSVH